MYCGPDVGVDGIIFLFFIYWQIISGTILEKVDNQKFQTTLMTSLVLNISVTQLGQFVAKSDCTKWAKEGVTVMGKGQFINSK